MQLTLRKLSGGTTDAESRDNRIREKIAGREQGRRRRRGIYQANKAVRQLPRTDEGNVPATD